MICGRKELLTAFATLLVVLASMSPAAAQQTTLAVKSSTRASTLSVPKLYSWMSSDVGVAWSNKYYGQGTTITVIDDFSSSSKFYGNLTGSVMLQRHGEFTRLETSLIAPSATIRSKDFSTTSTAVSLAPGLNVLNLSYGMYASNGYSAIRWGNEEASIISYAINGRAVVSKAAGNDAIPVWGVTSSGQKDYLDTALIGAQSAIFAGALDRNGTVNNPASLAWYSNSAGTDLRVQSHFLVVGVEGDKTGLYGTSFAAPIISGYAAVVASKFRTATPTQITNKLLDTARTNTLANYNPATFGRGEACLSCALAPLSIQ